MPEPSRHYASTEEDQEDVPGRIVPNALRGRAETILVLEGDRGLRELLRSLLGSLSYEVLAVAADQQALAAYRSA